jgi:virginiamycin B lyase
MSQFVQVVGDLTQISVASATVAWGLNSKGDVFQYGFGIGCLKSPWIPEPGKLSQISVGSASNVWGVNSTGEVYRFTEKSGWELELGRDLPLPSEIVGVAYPAKGLVAAALDGTVCALISMENVSYPDAPPAFFSLVYKWNGEAFAPISVPDEVLQIAVGSKDNIWALSPPSAEGSVALRYTGGGDWQTISGAPSQLVTISAGGDSVWGLDGEGNIYRYPGKDSAPWDQIKGATLVQISVGSASNVWGIDSAANIYQHDESSNRFEQVTGSFQTVSAAADGTTWALTSANVPYLFAAQTPNGPGSGLGSYANYILCVAGETGASTSCKSLLGVEVTIKVTEALAAGSIGFSFQLNANSQGKLKDGSAPQVVWQQYNIVVVAGQIEFGINNWTTAGLLINPVGTPPLPLPTNPVPTIPKGYTLAIALETGGDDSVNGVTFTVVDNNGKKTTQPIVPFTLPSGAPVTAADLAPIVAFELNIVGPGNGHCAEFTTGAGTITYSATTPLTPLNQIPPCAALGDNAETTGETSNSVYGSLPSAQSNTFTQCFGVNPAVKCP